MCMCGHLQGALKFTKCPGKLDHAAYLSERLGW